MFSALLRLFFSKQEPPRQDEEKPGSFRCGTPYIWDAEARARKMDGRPKTIHLHSNQSVD